MMRSGTEWLDKRLQYITGTDVGKIMGVDPNTTAQMLLKIKLGFREYEPSDYGKDMMEMGRACEPLATESFKLYNLVPNSCTFEPGCLIVDDVCPFLAGTPDVIITAHSDDWVTHHLFKYYGFICYYDRVLKYESGCLDGTHKFLLEIKCRTYPSVNMASPYRCKPDIEHYTGVSGEMPIKDWLQLQHYLYLHKLPFGYLYSWAASGKGTAYCIRAEHYFYVHRVIPVLKEFYETVQRCKVDPGLLTESLAGLRHSKLQKSLTETALVQTIRESIVYEHCHTAYVVHEPPY